jgi:hypothetical protein
MRAVRPRAEPDDRILPKSREIISRYGLTFAAPRLPSFALISLLFVFVRSVRTFHVATAWQRRTTGAAGKERRSGARAPPALPAPLSRAGSDHVDTARHNRGADTEAQASDTRTQECETDERTYAVLSSKSFGLHLGVVGEHHGTLLGRLAAYLVGHLLHGLWARARRSEYV